MVRLSTNDYAHSLRAPLGRTVERARRAIERELNTASQMGHFGNTVQRAVDRFNREFDAGIFFVLARLKRARRWTGLDHSGLWQATVQELQNFKLDMISIMNVEGVAKLRLSQMSLVHSELSKLDERVGSALRQFQQSSINDRTATPLEGEEVAVAPSDLNVPPTELSGNHAACGSIDHAVQHSAWQGQVASAPEAISASIPSVDASNPSNPD